MSGMLASERASMSIGGTALVALVIVVIGVTTLILRHRIVARLYDVTHLKIYDVNTPSGRFNVAIQFLVAPLLMALGGAVALVWSLAILLD